MYFYCYLWTVVTSKFRWIAFICIEMKLQAQNEQRKFSCTDGSAKRYIGNKPPLDWLELLRNAVLKMERESPVPTSYIYRMKTNCRVAPKAHDAASHYYCSNDANKFYCRIHPRGTQSTTIHISLWVVNSFARMDQTSRVGVSSAKRRSVRFISFMFQLYLFANLICTLLKACLFSV